MKELSIEEKAKAYDEALEKAKMVLQERGNEPDGASMLSNLFPELTESEDEKIRKDLLGYLHTLPNHFSHNGGLVTEWIDWLEKQGGCSAEWKKNTANNKPAFNYSVLMKTTHGIAEGEWNGKEWIQYRWSSTIKDSDVLYWMNLDELEKQGEQKPNKCMYSNDNYTDEDRKVLCDGCEEDCKLKQKPVEWSEEDEEMLKSILATCEMYAETVPSSPGSHLLEMQEG